MVIDIDNTLKERAKTHGAFRGHATISQSLKSVMYSAPKWNDLSFSMKESLEMTQHKIARILNGDPMYLDHWHDIIGYIRLIETELLKETNT